VKHLEAGRGKRLARLPLNTRLRSKGSLEQD